MCRGSCVNDLRPVVGLAEGRQHVVKSVSDVHSVVNALDERQT